MQDIKQKASQRFGWRALLTSGFFLLLVVPVSFATVVLLQRTVPITAPANQSTVVTTSIDAQTAISKIQASINGAGLCEQDSINPIAYKTTGAEYAVFPDMDTVECIEVELSGDKKDIAHLQLKQFAEQWGMVVPYKSGDFQAIVTSDVVCNIDTNTQDQAPDQAETTDATYKMVISCANVDDYTAVAQRSTALQSAYASEKSDDYIAVTVATDQVPQPSTTEGYRIAQATITDITTRDSFVGLFYQKDEGKWRYAAELSDPMECSAYKNTDARKAFAGEPCRDAKGQPSTVSP